MLSDLDFRNEDGKYPPLGEFDNQKALEKLKKERNRVSASTVVLYIISLGSLIFSSSAGMEVILLAANQTKEVAILADTIRLMEKLLDEFEDEGIEIIPSVKVPENVAEVNQIDLFVRFPEKIFFAICIRKMKDSRITFREDKQLFYIRKQGSRRKGRSIWKPDPSIYLPECFRWLQKNEKSLFGGKSNDTRRPAVRILLLTGNTKIGTNHRQELYASVESNNYLWIKNQNAKLATCILEEETLMQFIKDFLKSKSNSTNSRKNQKHKLANVK